MRVSINSAIPGMVLNAPIINGDNLLMKKGDILTVAALSHLRRFPIDYIDIVSNRKDNAEVPNNTNVVNAITKTREALISGNLEEIAKSAEGMVSSIVSKLSSGGEIPDFKYDMQNNINSDKLTEHSIRVASFAIALARLYNEQLKKTVTDKGELSKQLINLQDISTAALFHDVGVRCQIEDIADDIAGLSANNDLRKLMPGILDVPTDKSDTKYTSLYSFCLANRIPEISDDAKYMILFSSEAENGNGPLRIPIKGNTKGFVVGSKIVHLCSIYDEILDYCVRNGQSFENITAILGQYASQGITSEGLTDLFLKTIPLYFIGNKVKLSTDEQAVVISYFKGYTYTTRPIVKTTQGQVIDLRKENNITIESIYQDDISSNDVAEGQLDEVNSRGKSA